MPEKAESESVWTATSETTAYPSLPGNLEVDVAVIGGGIAGLTTAWELKRTGHRVAVLEAARIGSGESGQTSGHLTQVLDYRFHDLASRFGTPAAALLAKAGKSAIDYIGTQSQLLGTETKFRRVPGFLYAAREEDVSGLDRELAAMKEAGLNASKVQKTPLPFAVPAALRVEDQAIFHVRNYLVPLAQKIHGDGSFVFENTRVTGAEDGTPCQVETSAGTVRARHVVIATSHAILMPTLHFKLKPYRTYALATVPDRPLEEGLYWDTEDPYHYTRTLEVSGEQLIIVGGGDHQTGHSTDTGDHMQSVERYAREKFGSRGTPRFTWSGQVEESVDGLPYIGQDGAREHFWVATGFAGNGLTLGTLAGLTLSDGINGKANELASLLSPTRHMPLGAAPSFMAKNADTALQFFAGRFSALGQSADLISDLKPGEGKTLTIEGHVAGVYCDDAGKCHAVSAVCTHQKGILSWNAMERSWDCPLHGGRFSARGEVLNGPPVKPLETVALPSPKK